MMSDNEHGARRRGGRAGTADNAPMVTDDAREGRERHPLLDPDTASPALRERVYATLVGLATALVLLDYAAETSAWSAAAELGGTMVGLFAASLVAEVVSHSGAHGELPRGRPLRRALLISSQVVEIAFVPVALVGLAATGLWTVRAGLIAAAVAFGATQVGVALLAARGSRLSRGRRVVLVLVETVLGALVVVIKLAVH
jgi:hypothetical protein